MPKTFSKLAFRDSTQSLEKKQNTDTPRLAVSQRKRQREQHSMESLYPTASRAGRLNPTTFFFSFHFIIIIKKKGKPFCWWGNCETIGSRPHPPRFDVFKKKKKRAPFSIFFLLKDNLYQFIRVDIFRYIQTRFLSIDVEFEKNGDIFRDIVSLACSTNPSAFLGNQFPSRMSAEFRITSNRGKDKGDATILSVRLYYGYLDASLRQRISLPVWIRLTEDAKNFLPWPETYRASAVSHFISEINKKKNSNGFLLLSITLVYYCLRVYRWLERHFYTEERREKYKHFFFFKLGTIF